jgi:nucleotidyltransferase substrate binding protein (TIGR01987 family)
VDDLTARVEAARKAFDRFASFNRSANASDDTRDLAIFWFVLSFEAIWKAAKAVLAREGTERLLQSGSPRNIIRESQIAGLLSEDAAKALLAALEDRNRAVHVYREALAVEVMRRLPDYELLFRQWVEAMEASLGCG